MFIFIVFVLIIIINTPFMPSVKVLIFKHLSPLNLKPLILIDFVILKVLLYLIGINIKTFLIQLK